MKRRIPLLVTPLSFLQLYTINVLVDHVSLPSAYILMANRQRVTYSRIFGVIRDQIEPVHPISLMMDFEEGYLKRH